METRIMGKYFLRKKKLCAQAKYIFKLEERSWSEVERTEKARKIYKIKKQEMV